ncbi:tRNA synthetase class II core domain (G, h, p, S and t) domain-containing protein [Ditylenchus destructor]|uniref:threonine--tRNA ligase n=1 Tax=Ditylenchus destructor TaxID=166010 RepID=A0AAD4R845_9BILA|nr:tRNA synthetase class II core domain (G, h, p, S and t) domain-containing protein [Ditylenchus destructor]
MSATVAKPPSRSAEEMPQWPTFIQQRIEMFDQLMEKYKIELANKPRVPIKITLPNGNEQEGVAWETTPLQIAEKINKNLAKEAVISKVNGELWDLDRPLEGDATVSILKFDDDEAKQVFWHSSAHVLGEACERFCGGHLCYGPPISEGFYYDMYKDDLSIAQEHFPKLQNIIDVIVKDKQPFERLVMKKEDLLEMFSYNTFKVRILQEKITEPETTVYRCGPLIDLCRGPHVRDTGKIKAIAVTKASSSYWQGDSNAETLQRVYGISFPDAKQMKEWQKFQEEAAKRDHRKIGKDQELFFFHPLSPGSAFWYPKGTYIYNKLIDFIRKEYRKRGFQEVISPNIYNAKLWEQSGHWDHYAENMFRFEVEKEQFALKPMNCPGHCLMFGHKTHTHNELPMRFADFGVLHRNEMSGALTGLTRVRRFQQDDAHIFCRNDQVADEIRGCLDFLNHVYMGIFGFSFKLFLSTRPEKYMGKLETWNEAEAQLKEALNASGHSWELNEGDGAFYGPKDALRRYYQCATIQLDFQLPEKFELRYFDEGGQAHRPVMIHRALLGSLERMIAILTENFGGKWPFWLSPRQLMVITVHPAMNEYGRSVYKKLFDAGFEVEFDEDSNATLNKRIRNAQLDQFNFILVVGEQEKKNGTVNVRTRDNKIRGEISIDEFIKKLQFFRDEYTKDTENQEFSKAKEDSPKEASN